MKNTLNVYGRQRLNMYRPQKLWWKLKLQRLQDRKRHGRDRKLGHVLVQGRDLVRETNPRRKDHDRGQGLERKNASVAPAVLVVTVGQSLTLDTDRAGQGHTRGIDLRHHPTAHLLGEIGDAPIHHIEGTNHGGDHRLEEEVSTMILKELKR